MTLRCVFALMLREMATRYGRSVGGYAWAILEPFGVILILSFGFSLLVRSPALGSSFLVFYATGYMPFSIYQSVSNTVARAINFNRPLMQYPAVTWVDAIIARFVLNALTGILVMLILLTVVLAASDSRTLIDLKPIVTATALTLLLGLGVGTLNCVLTGLIGAWEQVWSIISRPLFLASGILFLYDSMSPLLKDILWYNPLVHIIGLFRTGFYPSYRADYVSVEFAFGISLVTLFFGVVLMGRYHRDILQSR